jgi:predicted acyl esterase
MPLRQPRLWALVPVAATLTLPFPPGRQSPAFDTRTHYAKHEYRIPMRDGVALFTSVYTPTDTSRAYPFLINRTPYGIAPYGPDRFPPRLGPAENFDRAGYIFVFQDVRGRNQSEGDFVDMRPHADDKAPGHTDESTDTYDTVDWLLTHVPGNNGKAGIWGMSYPGFYAAASIIDSHPAIKAASPQAPSANLFAGDDAYHGGAFMLTAQFQVYSTFFKPRGTGPEFPADPWVPFDFKTDDGYRYFLTHGPGLAPIAASIGNPFFDDHVTHSTLDDYWRARDITAHLTGIRCAVLNVAGWFDAEDLAGPFRTYHAIERHNPGITNVLVVGPWAHGDWVRRRGADSHDVQSISATFYRERIVFPFFERFLKGAGGSTPVEATVFETGTNMWREYPSWPPPNLKTTTIYLRAQGKLSFAPPKAGERAYDEYVSDPAHPVPYVPYPATFLASEFMYGDQRFASTRPDVLTYVSEPLESDVTVAGPVTPRLHVSTSGTDADFDVKLIDVFPGHAVSAPHPAAPQEDLPAASGKTAGYQQLVRGEPMRARFRNSWSRPEAMRRGEVTPLTFEMPDVNHTFRRGHRIMVQIQSSWFPLTDLNPQTFVDTARAVPSDFVKATERVYHTPQAASGIVLGILPRR